jgi:hypothetical protein
VGTGRASRDSEVSMRLKDGGPAPPLAGEMLSEAPPPPFAGEMPL